jgi:hypothetical protein
MAPPGEAAFTGTTGSAGAFAAGALTTPTGLTASRPCPVASPSIRGFNVANSGWGTKSVTVNTPAGTVAGDGLVAVVVAATTANPTGIAKWGATGSRQSGTMTVQGFQMLYSDSPAASYTFSWNSGGEGVAILFSIINPDPNTVAVGAGGATGTGTTATSAAYTPDRVPGPMLLIGATGGNAYSTDPAGLTRVTTVSGADNLTVTNIWTRQVTSTAAWPTYSSTIGSSLNWIMSGLYLHPSLTAVADPTVALSWNGAAPATGYRITRNDGATFDVTGGATSYSDTTTTKTTAYSYTVTATAGSWSSSASASVPAAAC